MKTKSSLFDWSNYLFWVFSLLIIVKTDKLTLHLYFNSFHSKIGDFIMPHLTNVGDGLILLLFTFFVFLFRSRKLAIILFISFLISSGLVQFLKLFIFENHIPSRMAQIANQGHLAFETGSVSGRWGLTPLRSPGARAMPGAGEGQRGDPGHQTETPRFGNRDAGNRTLDGEAPQSADTLRMVASRPGRPRDRAAGER